MADAEPEGDSDEGSSKKGGKGPLIGVILAVLLGGGGFFASFSGMIPFLASAPAEPAKKPVKAMVAQPLASFLPLEQMVVPWIGVENIRFV